MSVTLPVLAFLLGLLAPTGESRAQTCTLQDWTWAGSYKICFYDCAGERVPHAINSSDTCPETYDKK